MKDALLTDDTDTRRVVNLLRSNFFANINPITVVEDQKDLSLFLIAEGVLVHEKDIVLFMVFIKC